MENLRGLMQVQKKIRMSGDETRPGSFSNIRKYIRLLFFLIDSAQ